MHADLLAEKGFGGMFIRIVTAISLMISVAAQAAAPVTGRWYTAGQQSIVEIFPCGASICGKVIKILKPTKQGPNPKDINNPDPKLRSRYIIGMTFLSGFADIGNQWSGTIYDPRSGKSYRSTMQKQKNGNLHVKGCWGPFCQTEIFTPAR